MQADLRKLKKRSGAASDSESGSDSGRRKGPSYLEQELSKYFKQRGLAAKARHTNRKGKKDEEDDLLEAMNKFSRKVKKEADEEAEDRRRAEEREKRIKEEQAEFEEENARMEAAVEDVDDDVGWMRHDLKFEVEKDENTRRAEEDYTVSRLLLV